MRVRVDARDVDRAAALAKLVRAAGHEVVLDGAEVVLADGGLERDDIASARPSRSNSLFDRVIQTSGDSASGHPALERDDIASAQPSRSSSLFDHVIQTPGDAASGHHALAPATAGVPVVMLGASDEGAAGVVLEGVSASVLDAVLRVVAAGLTVRPVGEPGGFASADEAPSVLTAREAEVLAAVGAGLSNKEVARRLGISAHTVKFHLEQAFRKLGAGSRAEAVAKGLRRGVIEV